MIISLLDAKSAYFMLFLAIMDLNVILFDECREETTEKLVF